MNFKVILLNILVIIVLIIMVIILAILYALSIQANNDISSSIATTPTTSTYITSTAITKSNLNLKYYNIFKSNSSPQYTISSYNGILFKEITSVVARKYAGTTYYFIIDVYGNNIIKMTIQPNQFVKQVFPAHQPWFMDASDSFLFVGSLIPNVYIMKYDFDLNHVMSKSCLQITGFNCWFVEVIYDSVDNLLYAAILKSRILKMTSDFQFLKLLPEVDTSDMYSVLRMNNGLLYANTGHLIRVFQNDSYVTSYSIDIISSNSFGIEIDPNGYFIYTCPVSSTVKLSTPNETFALIPNSYSSTRNLRFDLEGRLMVSGVETLYFYY